MSANSPAAVKPLLASSLRTAFLVACILSASQAVSQSSAAVSRYTRLTHPPCKTTHVQTEGANSEQLCPGIGGYQLLLLDSDGRMSVTIISPDGAKHPLDFWTTVTPHFSAVGKTAEWRVRTGSPSSLILPLAIQEDPDSGKSTTYRLVVKLTPQTICIVTKLPVTASVEAVHEAADNGSTSRSCLKP